MDSKSFKDKNKKITHFKLPLSITRRALFTLAFAVITMSITSVTYGSTILYASAQSSGSNMGPNQGPVQSGASGQSANTSETCPQTASQVENLTGSGGDILANTLPNINNSGNVLQDLGNESATSQKMTEGAQATQGSTGSNNTNVYDPCAPPGGSNATG